MSLCLYLELLNASQLKGYAIGRRQELHAQCRMNRVTALRASPTKGASGQPQA
jgi:hypothetical protein